MKQILSLAFILCLVACKPAIEFQVPTWERYDEADQISFNANHKLPRMQYKLIQSKTLDKNKIWSDVQDQIKQFSELEYQKLKPLILEQDIPTLQSHIKTGKLTYEKLTQWYLYRIVKIENDNDKTLHTIISLNPNAVAIAKKRDQQRSEGDHMIYGMPVLLKDNINTEGMPTTAGALALKNNQTKDAHIVKRIKANGGIILGKVNLSEWAYYLCQGCPLGYSAIGGQTLNPYGRMDFETGGSSAGSGTSMAANYAAAAIGTETSGSILSPSSQNSVVGLKPTIGALSRTGIVPISSSLDTPGPMTRSVIDNAILYSAMIGEDKADTQTVGYSKFQGDLTSLESATLKQYRFGINKAFLTDSLYQLAVQQIRDSGADTVHFVPAEMNFEGFTTFLNAEMKIDLPNYLKNHAHQDVPHKTVMDIVEFNKQDTTLNIPYGQFHFEATANENISSEDFAQLKARFFKDAVQFFEVPMSNSQLDAILSINNYNAGHAAMARFPAITVPMGYQKNGEPKSLTFIARPFQETKLLRMAIAFEKITHYRKAPEGYN